MLQLQYIRFGLALSALAAAIMALYKTYKTTKMEKGTLAALDSQKTALKYSVIGIILAVALTVIRGI